MNVLFFVYIFVAPAIGLGRYALRAPLLAAIITDKKSRVFALQIAALASAYRPAGR